MKTWLIAELARIALLGLPLVGETSGVVVEASGDAFNDAMRFYREAGWQDADALVRFFGPARER